MTTFKNEPSLCKLGIMVMNTAGSGESDRRRNGFIPEHSSFVIWMLPATHHKVGYIFFFAKSPCKIRIRHYHYKAWGHSYLNTTKKLASLEHKFHRWCLALKVTNTINLKLSTKIENSFIWLIDYQILRIKQLIYPMIYCSTFQRKYNYQ